MAFSKQISDFPSGDEWGSISEIVNKISLTKGCSVLARLRTEKLYKNDHLEVYTKTFTFRKTRGNDGPPLLPPLATGLGIKKEYGDKYPHRYLGFPVA